MTAYGQDDVKITLLLPFFLILSCDLGRIFFYWIASSFAVFLLIPKEKIEKLFPVFYVEFIKRINSVLANILYPTKTTVSLIMMFIGVPIADFLLGGTSGNVGVVGSSLIYNVLWMLSKFILILKKIIFILF